MSLATMQKRLIPFKAGAISLALFLLILLNAFFQPAYGAEIALGECIQGLSVDNALWQECDLGDYIADALRVETGADIALVPGGLLEKALAGVGTVTESMVEDCFAENCSVFCDTISPAELKSLLEEGVSHWVQNTQEVLDGDASSYTGYLQISGFSVKYDASAPIGDRVLSIRLGGAEESLDLTEEGAIITAAIPGTMELEREGDSKGTLVDLVKSYIQSQGTVTLKDNGRVTVIGAHAKDLIDYVPPVLLVAVLGLLIVNAALFQKRKRDREG